MPAVPRPDDPPLPSASLSADPTLEPLDAATPDVARRPIVWSISGNDSAGGAGLSADARMAEGFEVHLCPIVACVTAQHSRGVERVMPVSASQLDAQLAALADDLPPDAIKTGLLGDAALVAVVARWVDRLRRSRPGLPLVVDPTLRASTGALYTDAVLLAAYQEQLLPRATVLTPNRREAVALLAEDDTAGLPFQPDAVAPRGAPPPARASLAPAPPRAEVPALARALRQTGALAVIISNDDDGAAGHPDAAAPDTDLPGLALDWVDTDLARGWLALPQPASPHHRGSSAAHATALAAALARGFVDADAAVLARMAAAAALRHGHAAGAGAGPVGLATGFVHDPSLLPRMTWGEDASALAHAWTAAEPDASDAALGPGIYALVDDAARIPAVLAAADDRLCALQLRLKREAHAHLDDAAFDAWLQDQLADAAQALAGRPVTLVVNDHWRAAAVGRAAHPTVRWGVHLGQEDLAALGPSGRAALRRALSAGANPAVQPIGLGISSHSLWELARAAGLATGCIACGPVWPTLTKAMPWRAQGLDNLRWWSAMAPLPVVAIGGILKPDQLEACVAAGASAVCLVRALNGAGLADWPTWGEAWVRGTAARTDSVPAAAWPHPSLDPATVRP